MANTILTADIIAKKALYYLKNECVMSKLVYRGYEEDFSKSVNGYQVGDTVSIRRPAQYVVNQGEVAVIQDHVEGKMAVKVDKFKNITLNFSHIDLSLSLDDLSDRVIKPMMIEMANAIDADLTDLYKEVWNWAGTPGQNIKDYAAFLEGPTRLNEMSVPLSDRCAVLTPRDYAGMTANQTGLFAQSMVADAYRENNLDKIGGVMTHMAQNVKSHVNGAVGGTPLIRGAGQSVTYAAVKDTYQQTLSTDGWSASANLKKGDVFTIDGVFAINPRNKTPYSYKQQFVIKSDVTTNATTTNETLLTISPPIITSGAFQTVSAAPADNAAITYVGSASQSYAQNMVFHKNAFTLVMAPLYKPNTGESAVVTDDGMSVRVWQADDIINNKAIWRADVLYGVMAIQPELATRLSGSV